MNVISALFIFERKFKSFEVIVKKEAKPSLEIVAKITLKNYELNWIRYVEKSTN